MSLLSINLLGALKKTEMKGAIVKCPLLAHGGIEFLNAIHLFLRKPEKPDVPYVSE